jgi:hypothetical protein
MLDRPDHNRRAEQRRLRDRRLRERRKSGRACYMIEADAEVLYLLVKLHWLAERQLTDKAAVEAALSEMVIASAHLERLAEAAR